MDSIPYKPGWIQKPVKILLSIICLQLDSSSEFLKSQRNASTRIMWGTGKRNVTLYLHLVWELQDFNQPSLDPDPPVDMEIKKLQNNRIFHHWKHPKLLQKCFY